MVKCVVHYDLARTAGVEDIKVSVFDTGTTEVGGGECPSVKRSSIDQFILATSPLVNHTIFERQVADIFGRAWTCVFVSIDQGVMGWVAKVKFHPFSSWMVIVSERFCLRFDVNGDTL